MSENKHILLHESEKIYITGEVGGLFNGKRYADSKTYYKLIIHRNSTRGKQTVAVDLDSLELLDEIKKGDLIRATVDIVTVQNKTHFFNNIYCHEIKKIIVKQINK